VNTFQEIQYLFESYHKWLCQERGEVSLSESLASWLNNSINVDYEKDKKGRIKTEDYRKFGV
jgi:hypothetical protein